MSADRPVAHLITSSLRGWVIVSAKGIAMTEKSAGGLHWELGEAREQMIAAQLANDAAALTLALMRLADALVNAASSGSADALVPLLLQLREARGEAHKAASDRRSDAIVSEHNQNLLIDQAEVVQAEQGKQAARLGMAEASILALLLARGVSNAGRQALTAQIAELERRIAALEALGERGTGNEER